MKATVLNANSDGDCCDALAANFLAMVQLASMRPWLRAYESAA
jgi:hypothetical protein